MEFQANRSALTEALKTLSGALISSTGFPILDNILVESIDKDTIQLTANHNFDLHIRTRIPAQVAKPGRMLIPTRIRNLASAFTDDVVAVSGSDQRAVVRSGKGHFALNTAALSEFPGFPTIDWTQDVTLPTQTFQAMIAHTVFAAAVDVNRPTLNGGLWETLDGETRMVTSNGHQLALYSAHTNGSTPKVTTDFIVPTSALKQLLKVFSATVPVAVGFGQNLIAFRDNQTTIVSRLIDGPFPEYRRVIPAGNDRRLRIATAHLTEVLQRMDVMVGATDTNRKIRLKLSENSTTVRCDAQELGDGNELLEGLYEGDPLEIGFNARYLLDILRCLKSPEVELTFKQPETAATVRPIDPPAPETEVTYVLMPVRLLD